MNRILFADRDERLYNKLYFALHEEGFATEFSSDGEDALSRLMVDRTRFDVLVIDSNLPSMNGIELLKRVRTAQLHVPILMLSEMDDAMERILSLELGADDCVTKPVHVREMVLRIQALSQCRHRVNRPFEPRDGEMRLGNMKLRVNERECLIDRYEIRLTPVQVQVLKALFQKPGSVVLREELMLAAWGKIVHHHLLAMQISLLRQKFDAVAMRSHEIETVHHRGYRLAKMIPSDQKRMV
ncbi:response regulator transcription factor [Ferroacidibacillus organovorans]|uniref:DNA-binding response regulator n=1 Tax=Ferroacidibacillus organovorans TaxID=1765683 RepID=A0A117SYK5_9BACL|nr:response regulator transcription factor [Ferroacidibacillus organovorans]KUO97098.1 hypothetical protein ATW55_12355 [Ferroacidibacillus organovorans]